MNLKIKSDDELIKVTKQFVSKERCFTADILKFILEIDRRRLYSDYNCKSLFDFLTREIGYSDGQAARRIQASRLLQEIPEITEEIKKGELTLTNISTLKTFFDHKKCFSLIEKRDLLTMAKNKTTRELEDIIYKDVEDRPSRETIKRISKNNMIISFQINNDVFKKLEIVKGLLLSHGIKKIEVIFERGLDEIIEKINKNRTSLVSAKIRRKLIQTKGNYCQKCGSTYNLEIDHITPRAKGGGDNLSNLRILCRSCNQREAIKVFGVSKMEKYLLRRRSKFSE